MKFESVHLGNIADIRFGVHAKGDPAGTVPVVQVKDVVNGIFNSANIIRMIPTLVREQDYLQDNNVLFSGKGRIVALKWSYEKIQAVASNSFFVVRIQTSSLTPDFLTAYLNSNQVRKEIGRRANISTVMHLSIDEIRNLKIPLPPLAVQQKFARLAELVREEKKNYDEIISNKEKILDCLL